LNLFVIAGDGASIFFYKYMYVIGGDIVYMFSYMPLLVTEVTYLVICHCWWQS